MIVKPGFQTTEMLVTVLASVGSWLAEWQGSLQPKWAALATTVSAAAYALSRAIVKHGVATGNAQIVPVAAVPPASVQTPPVVTGPQAV
jgi:hypothetical protein